MTLSVNLLRFRFPLKKNKERKETNWPIYQVLPCVPSVSESAQVGTINSVDQKRLQLGHKAQGGSAEQRDSVHLKPCMGSFKPLPLNILFLQV